MDGAEKRCAVCGVALPNRYAVAGRCGADGCESLFCAMHWRRGNGLCPAHGWAETPGGGTKGGGTVDEAVNEIPGSSAPAETPRRRETAGGAVAKAALKGSVKLGAAAVAYFRRLCGIRDPKAALAEADSQLAEVRRRLEPLAARYEELHGRIVAKKKARDAASPAKRKMLDMQLRPLLAEYRSIEREVEVLYRKEEMVVTVRGRMEELAVQGLPMPKVEDVDRLADDIENVVDRDEDLVDSVAELATAGVRRERHVANLDEELAMFDEESPVPEETPADGMTLED